MAMHTSTWLCTYEDCEQRIKLTVHAEKALTGGRMDGRTMDRARLLAASNGWVIDWNRHAWCPRHKAKPEGKSIRAKAPHP